MKEASEKVNLPTDKKRKTCSSPSFPLLALNTGITAGAGFPSIISCVLAESLNIPHQIA